MSHPRIVSALALLVVASALVAVVGGRASRSRATDSAALQRQAASLVALEAPLRRDLKHAYVAPAPRALARARADATRVTDWLTRHPTYAEANRPSTACLFSTLGRLQTAAASRNALRGRIAEAVNCVQGE